MFELPKLGYSYDALEPYFDRETMEIHHTKHHQAYTNKFNDAMGETGKSAEDIIRNINDFPEDKRTAIRNNGGGYVNHNLFFGTLKKDVECHGEILEAINKKFESFEKFKEEFSNAAKIVFGSGWAWLVVNNNELEIVMTANQDSPLSDGKTPILSLDVWEHAYYLKFQNKRPEYIENFFKVINWDRVNELYKEAIH